MVRYTDMETMVPKHTHKDVDNLQQQQSPNNISNQEVEPHPSEAL